MIYELPFFLSSDTSESPNIIKSTDGSTFTVFLQPSVAVPPNAKNIKVFTPETKFWYTFKNISVAKANNKLYITNDAGNPTKYTLTIDDGLYSLSELENALDYQIVLAGLPTGTLQLSADNATGKVIFTLASGYQIYFGTNSCYVLLGCTNLQKIPSGGLTGALYSEKAPSVATFSNLTSVLFHCSLVSNSILNGRGSDVIASVAPNTTVGSLQIDRPYNVIKVPCPNLQNITINQITVSITDQLGNLLDTNSETFQITVVLEYEI